MAARVGIVTPGTLQLTPVARGLLPARPPAPRRAGLCRLPVGHRRDKRLLLLAAAPDELPELVPADSAQLRVLSQGRALHHPPEETRRRRNRTRELLRLWGARAQRQAGAGAVAAAAQSRLPPAAAGRLLRPLAALDGGGRVARAAPRRAGQRASPERFRLRPAAAPRAGGTARELSHRIVHRVAA